MFAKTGRWSAIQRDFDQELGCVLGLQKLNGSVHQAVRDEHLVAKVKKHSVVSLPRERSVHLTSHRIFIREANTMRTVSGRPSIGTRACPLRRPLYRAHSCRSFRSQRLQHDRSVSCDAHAQHPPRKGLVAHLADSGDLEKDACGVGFVGELTKEPSRKCVVDALSMLVRMTHRGACGCEENTGTGERSLS
jgi:hypothetical protein